MAFIYTFQDRMALWLDVKSAVTNPALKSFAFFLHALTSLLLDMDYESQSIMLILQDFDVAILLGLRYQGKTGTRVYAFCESSVVAVQLIILAIVTWKVVMYCLTRWSDEPQSSPQ